MVYRHPTKDESFVLLRGRVRVYTYNDDGSVIESVVLCPEDGLYGVDIPKNVWHNVECLESRSVFFECKEGPFVPHEVEGVLRLHNVNLNWRGTRKAQNTYGSWQLVVHGSGATDGSWFRVKG